MTEEQAKEAIDRLRRIETRLVTLLRAMNVETGAALPLFSDPGVVAIPSMSCSVKDLLAVIPVDYLDCGVEVRHQGDLVAEVTPRERRP